MSAHLVEKITGWCIDWNGAPMVDGEPPRIVPTVGDLKMIASTIEAQAAEIERLTVENSTLAADQCHEGYGDEYGNHQCRVIDRLRSELAAKDAAVQILLGIPLVCVTDAEIAHAKEQRAAAIRASGKEG